MDCPLQNNQSLQTVQNAHPTLLSLHDLPSTSSYQFCALGRPLGSKLDAGLEKRGFISYTPSLCLRHKSRVEPSRQVYKAGNCFILILGMGNQSRVGISDPFKLTLEVAPQQSKPPSSTIAKGMASKCEEDPQTMHQTCSFPKQWITATRTEGMHLMIRCQQPCLKTCPGLCLVFVCLILFPAVLGTDLQGTLEELPILNRRVLIKIRHK